MRTPANNPIGTAAQSAVKAQFELLGWGVAPNPEHDLGTDHWVMARDDARVDIRRLVGVQVKAGATPFKQSVHVDGVGRRVARQLGALAAATFSTSVRRRSLARESRAEQDEPLISDWLTASGCWRRNLADFLRTRRGLFSPTPHLTCANAPDQ